MSDDPRCPPVLPGRTDVDAIPQVRLGLKTDVPHPNPPNPLPQAGEGAHGTTSRSVFPSFQTATRSTGIGLLITEAICLALVIAGLLVMLSPVWVSGGVVGWYHEYQVQEDVLLIGWFGTTAASVVLGFGLSLAGAVAGITAGLVGGVWLLGRRSPAPQEDLPPKQARR